MALLTNAAESNRGQLLVVPEVTWGTIPGSGVVNTMRFTKSSLGLKKQTTTSDEIRADRMVSDIIEVGASTDGDIDFEFSAGSQDWAWEQFLLGTWSRAMNFLLVKGASVSVSGVSEITLAGKDWRNWITVNQHVKLEGFLDPANNGYFKVTVKAFTAGNTVLTVAETSLVVEAGSAFTKLTDANDVIQKSTLTTFVSTNKINGGGVNAFAGQTLYVGQKIYLEGLGKETAAIQIESTDPTEGDKFKISDGASELQFEIRTNAALVAPGNVHVALSTDQITLRDNIATAIMNQFRRRKFKCSATKTAGTKEAGSVVFTTVADAGDTVTIFDGVNTTVFTFAASGNGATGAAVDVAVGATATDSATNLRNAITANVNVNVTAGGTTTTVSVTNDNYTGGSITKSDADNDYAVTNFSGGVDPTVVVKNNRQVGGSITESLACLTAAAFSGGDAAKAGVYTIASLPDDDSIVVAETLTNDANGGGLTVVIKGSHVRNPGDPLAIIKRSVSLETGFTDVVKYLTHNGMRVGMIKTSIAPGDKIKGSMSFMGRETLPNEATVLGNSGAYTVLESTGTAVLNATSNFANLLINGEPFTTAILKIDLDFDAGLRVQPAVGEKFPAGIGYGRFVPKGSFTVYFTNFDQWSAFKNHDTASLSWSLQDTDSNTYYFNVPALKYTTAPLPLDGIDKDVQSDVAWSAMRDPVLGTMFMVDRFSSLWPASVA